jgi:hypothetical protein
MKRKSFGKLLDKLSKYSHKPTVYIDGERLVDRRSEFLVQPDRVVIIRGLLPCPECRTTLYRNSGVHWCCPECLTRWTASELVQAIEAEMEATGWYSAVSIRNLID